MTPDRKRFYAIYQKAIVDGKLVPPTSCELCGVAPEPTKNRRGHLVRGIVGHHHCYQFGSELDVRWLCSRCHSVANTARQQGVSWDRMLRKAVPDLQNAGILPEGCNNAPALMGLNRRKVRRVKPFTRSWEKAANEYARSLCEIVPCEDCGNPRHEGYRCGYCDYGFVPHGSRT